MAHLRHLSKRFELEGNEVLGIWIYAEAPDYTPIDDDDEGFTCVDDTARFAVAAMLNAERVEADDVGDIRAALDFVVAMQGDDGRFYNFVFPDGTINREGHTSFLNHGWWAGRALWALGKGTRFFATRDVGYSELLLHHASKLLPSYDQHLERYGEHEEVDGHQVPAWLVKGGSDMTSEAVLGLLELYQHTPSDEELENRIVRFCDGMAEFQVRDPESRLHGAHPSSTKTPRRWHHWGSRQTFALARAARVLRSHPNSSRWLESARFEADHFFRRLLDTHLPELIEEDEITPYPQIAYGINTILLGAVELHRTTGEQEYLDMALEAASWYAGENPASTVMYDETTGRCFDGIRGPDEVNRNSGAESTIEAILALEELVRELE